MIINFRKSTFCIEGLLWAYVLRITWCVSFLEPTSFYAPNYKSLLATSRWTLSCLWWKLHHWTKTQDIKTSHNHISWLAKRRQNLFLFLPIIFCHFCSTTLLISLQLLFSRNAFSFITFLCSSPTVRETAVPLSQKILFLVCYWDCSDKHVNFRDGCHVPTKTSRVKIRQQKNLKEIFPTAQIWFENRSKKDTFWLYGVG